MNEIHGADVSTLVPVEGWTALKQDRGVSLGIVRCYPARARFGASNARTFEQTRETGRLFRDVRRHPSTRLRHVFLPY